MTWPLPTRTIEKKFKAHIMLLMSQLLVTPLSQGATMSTSVKTESSNSPGALHSNPIPIAAVATTHVDQIHRVKYSPPQPLNAFSPVSDSQCEARSLDEASRDGSEILSHAFPLNLPSSETPLTVPSLAEESLDQLGVGSRSSAGPNIPVASLASVATSFANTVPRLSSDFLPGRKPHPADLVCLENPDPHQSPLTTPLAEGSPNSSGLHSDRELSLRDSSRVLNGNRSPSDLDTNSTPTSVSKYNQRETENLSSQAINRKSNDATPTAKHQNAAHNAEVDEMTPLQQIIDAKAVSKGALVSKEPFNAITGDAEPIPAAVLATDDLISHQYGATEPENTSVLDQNSGLVKLINTPNSPLLHNGSSQISVARTSASGRAASRPSSAGGGTVTISSAKPSPVIRSPISPDPSSTSPGEAATTMPASPPTTEERDREKARRDKDKESHREKESMRSRKVLGEWSMTKTLGAGSMGKVKLAVSGITGEKVAIKIIPRFTSTAAAHRPSQPTEKESLANNAKSHAGGSPGHTQKKKDLKPTASFLANAATKDASKEIRTMREGSLCLLLHHPYVCGMKSVVLYPHHYYMVCEYVNGGQMLDYIISHGRLRERSARKFARQIGSALEYCHANSIVHRDLKIENILISKTGNIKIIDFGLSNLYNTTSHLNTFCGSLYFAAPELLNAKPYTGPEVDVWSFGIVMYVLVCGKVPFDDQSMPALHTKIKRGHVEYPTWLSAECKHLLSRMLVTNPTQRATLSEVLSHPWIVKGFTGPPTSHLPHRDPLRIEDINSETIKGMSGFEFGTETEIEEKLVAVLSSDLYLQALKRWEETRRASLGGDAEDKSSERPATRTDGKDMRGNGRSPTNKRFSGLGFYSKKIAGGFNAAFSGVPEVKKSEDDTTTRRDSASLINGVSTESLDPTRGFHPLVSIYFLVKEKVEREKIYGSGVFASSTVSLTGPPPPPAPAQAYQSGSGSVPKPPVGKLAKPIIISEAHDSHTLALPVPRTPQPRQRATGEEFGPVPATAPLPSQGNQYRANDYASKRTSFNQPSIPSSSVPTSPAVAHSATQVTPNEPSSPASTNVSRRQSVQLEGPSALDRGEAEIADEPLTTSLHQGTFVKRFGSLLSRSQSNANTTENNYKGHRTRASIAGIAHKAGNKTTATALPQVHENNKLAKGGSDVPLPSPNEGSNVTRASTVSEGSPSRHLRGASMGAGKVASVSIRGAAVDSRERKRQTSLGTGSIGRPTTLPPVLPPLEGLMDDHTETLMDQGWKSSEIADTLVPEPPRRDVGFVGRTAPSDGTEQSKPVWLKGLFSVTTTTTKSVTTIRADLVRVLENLGVQFRDVKSGFECAHVPSIDLSSIGGKKRDKEDVVSGKSTIRKKASKMLRGGSLNAAEGSQTSLGGDTERARATSSTSFSANEESAPPVAFSSSPNDTSKFKSSTAESSTISSELIVRFEIFIVKMPLLPGINGLQFRRIGGNAWQYQMLARRVLQELKL